MQWLNKFQCRLYLFRILSLTTTCFHTNSYEIKTKNSPITIKNVSPTRLELVTPTLKVWCSTNWAKRTSVFNKKAYMWSLQTILRSHSTNIKLEPTFAVCFLFLWRYRIELDSMDSTAHRPPLPDLRWFLYPQMESNHHLRMDRLI